jgi:hypothetical protein
MERLIIPFHPTQHRRQYHHVLPMAGLFDDPVHDVAHLMVHLYRMHLAAHSMRPRDRLSLRYGLGQITDRGFGRRLKGHAPRLRPRLEALPLLRRDAGNGSRDGRPAALRHRRPKTDVGQFSAVIPSPWQLNRGVHVLFLSTRSDGGPIQWRHC